MVQSNQVRIAKDHAYKQVRRRRAKNGAPPIQIPMCKIPKHFPSQMPEMPRHAKSRNRCTHYNPWLSSLQNKGHGQTGDESDGAGNELGGTGLGDLAGGGRGLLSRDGGQGNGGVDDGGGGRRERGVDDRRGGGVPDLGGSGPGRGGVGRDPGGGDGRRRRRRRSRGRLRRARGQGDGLDAVGGGDNVSRLAGLLRLLGLVGGAIALALGDLEGERVLEDLGVALELEDETVGGLGAERGVDGPLVGLLGVGNAACAVLVLVLVLFGLAQSELTSNLGNGDKSALVGTTDQRDGDGLVLVLGGSLPGNLEGRAGGNLSAILGGEDGIEVGGLGDGRGGEGQSGGDGEEAHFGGVLTG